MEQTRVTLLVDKGLAASCLSMYICVDHLNSALVFPANRRAGARRKGGRGNRGTHRLLAATDLRSTSRRPGASGGNSSMQLRSWGSGSSMWSEMNNLFPSCQIHHPKPLYTAIVFWSQSVSVCIMSIIPTMMAIPMIGGCCECPRYE